jgi:hypothetical protein
LISINLQLRPTRARADLCDFLLSYLHLTNTSFLWREFEKLKSARAEAGNMYVISTESDAAHVTSARFFDPVRLCPTA